MSATIDEVPAATETTAAPARQQPATQAELAIGGMTCASCVARVERKLSKLEGVRSASVNLATERASVAYDPARVSPAQLIAAVEAAGYGAAPVVERMAAGADEEDSRRRDLANRRRTLGLGVVLSALVLVLAMAPGLLDFPTARSHNYLLA